MEVIEINDCQSCTNEPFEGDSFCRHCGSELPEPDMFECPECDAEVFEEDSFCYSCGTKFEGLQEEQEELDIDAPQPFGQARDAPQCAVQHPRASPVAPRSPMSQPSAPGVPPHRPGFNQGF